MRNDKNEYLDNLSFQKIYAFFAVAKCGSFTKAAERLNMSQAAVSRIIANIELETKLILFIRNVKGAHLTPAGRLLYQRWKEAVRDFDAGYRDAYKVQMGYIRNLAVGSINMEQNLNRHIPFWDWLEKTFSKEVLTVDFDKADVLRDGLISHKYDLIFLNAFEMDYLKMLDIHCRILVPRTCSLYIHEKHPLYTKETISDVDLKNQDITFLEQNLFFLQKKCRNSAKIIT